MRRNYQPGLQSFSGDQIEWSTPYVGSVDGVTSWGLGPHSYPPSFEVLIDGVYVRFDLKATNRDKWGDVTSRDYESWNGTVKLRVNNR